MSLDVSKITSSNAYKAVAKKADSLATTIGKGIDKASAKDSFAKFINNIEPTGGNNAFLGMTTLMLGTVIVPRVLTAAKRNPDDKEATKDEITEILFRDVQTVAIVLFALKAINSIVAGKTSKITGLPMTNKPYQNLFNNNDKGLKGISEKAKEFIHNPVDKLKIIGKNVLDTLHPTDGVRALTNDEFVAKYSNFNSIPEIGKLFEQIKSEGGDVNKTFAKVMDDLIKKQKATMEAEKAKSLAGYAADSKAAQKVLESLETLKEKGLDGLKDDKLDNIIKEQLVDFFQKEDNALVMSAKKLNAILRTGALAFESAYLGFGLPALNQQRLKKKYLSAEGAQQTQTQPQQSGDKLILTNKNVNDKEVKIYSQFIK